MRAIDRIPGITRWAQNGGGAAPDAWAESAPLKAGRARNSGERVSINFFPGGKSALWPS